MRKSRSQQPLIDCILFMSHWKKTVIHSDCNVTIAGDLAYARFLCQAYEQGGIFMVLTIGDTDPRFNTVLSGGGGDTVFSPLQRQVIVTEDIFKPDP